MSFTSRLIPYALAAMCFIAVSGCSPAEQSPEDEEKEPHFVLGTSRFNGFDYDGAIEAFQQALEVNPRSAQAHYQLAQIYDTKRPDPAAAIYHYQEYLRLDKQAQNAEAIRERITTCKQQLAQDVMTMPTAPRTMRQIEDLTETNRLLQAQVDRLTDSVKQWSAYAGTLQAAARNNPAPAPASQNNPAASLVAGGLTPDDVSTPASTPVTAPPRAAANRSSSTHTSQTRTHVVASGETLASIARKRGLSLTALEAANPGVSPKKLRAGQTLNLP